MTDLFSLLRARRGWSDEMLDELNNADHPLLLDIDTLAAELHALATSGDKLVIYPDIDMDGITAGTLGYAGLSELGFNVALYIPNAENGHGMRSSDVEIIRATHPDVAAIITCDTGIDSFSGVDAAHHAGIKVFVTDHHKEILRGDKTRLAADVIVNPQRIDETYPHPLICGAHVLYQVIERYGKLYRPDKAWEISLLRLFAGIGTVTDVMPILYENRPIVRDAVSITRLLYSPQDASDWRNVITAPTDASILVQILVAQGNHHPRFISAFRGMATFIHTLEDNKKLRSIRDVNESFFGFTAGPIFNSIRRMSMPMVDAFGVFFAPEPQPHIETIIETNERRKETTKTLAEALMLSVQPYAPFIYIGEMPGGMTGLVAQQLSKTSGWPTLVLRRNGERLTGSGRSPGWYDFNSSLNDAGFWAAGHEHAFGAGVDSIDDLVRLYEHLAVDVPERRREIEAGGESLEERADLVIGCAPWCDTTLEDQEQLLLLAEQIELLGPYGHDFTRPMIDIVVNAANLTVDTLGSESQHLSFISEEGFKMLWWNKSELIDELTQRIEDAQDAPEGQIDYITLRGILSINIFKGISSANLIVESLT